MRLSLMTQEDLIVTIAWLPHNHCKMKVKHKNINECSMLFCKTIVLSQRRCGTKKTACCHRW